MGAVFETTAGIMSVAFLSSKRYRDNVRWQQNNSPRKGLWRTKLCTFALIVNQYRFTITSVFVPLFKIVGLHHHSRKYHIVQMMTPLNCYRL
jgi:hypothetical protein